MIDSITDYAIHMIKRSMGFEAQNIYIIESSIRNLPLIHWQFYAFRNQNKALTLERMLAFQKALAQWKWDLPRKQKWKSEKDSQEKFWHPKGHH